MEVLFPAAEQGRAESRALHGRPELAREEGSASCSHEERRDTQVEGLVQEREPPPLALPEAEQGTEMNPWISNPVPKAKVNFSPTLFFVPRPLPFAEWSWAYREPGKPAVVSHPPLHSLQREKKAKGRFLRSRRDFFSWNPLNSRSETPFEKFFYFFGKNLELKRGHIRSLFEELKPIMRRMTDFQIQNYTK